MQVSLVTTCLNEIASLPRWRADLQAQTRFPDEIVIVDSESADGTRESLREWTNSDRRVRLQIEKCSVARGRNIAIQRARHDVLLSTDMGVRLDPYWVEEMCRPFEQEPDIDLVMGNYKVDQLSIGSAAARAEAYICGDGSPFVYNSSGQPILRTGTVPGNRSVAYTRALWQRLGGLPEDLSYAADDSVFGRQVLLSGATIRLAPKAITYWERPRKLRKFWREQRGYGRGDGEAAIKTPIAYRWHLKKRCPAALVPLLTALRWGTKITTFRGIMQALQQLDFPASLLAFPLQIGNGYQFGRGYVEGFSHGNVYCQGCRARLADTSRLTRIS
jgi:glycosyltransferase involved in cell wall biosynthesis